MLQRCLGDAAAGVDCPHTQDDHPGSPDSPLKHCDSGKPEPGEGAKEVTKLERVVEKIETPAASSDSLEKKLTELNSMKEKGLITDEEYQAMRKKALGL